MNFMNIYYHGENVSAKVFAHYMKRIVLFVVCCLLLMGCTNESHKKMEESEEKVSEIKVIINNVYYTLTLENNHTVDELIDLLPMELTMNDLNGNEKYAFLDTTFTTNSYHPNHIEVGDVMLYEDNCFVIFYQSFDTTFRYTKIGHINNLGDLGNGSIIAKIEK